MEIIPQRYIPEPDYITFTAGIAGRKQLAEGFPTAYWADSIEDLKEGRGKQLAELLKEKIFWPTPGKKPVTLGVYSPNKISAIVVIPRVQHFPAYDPQEESRWHFFKAKSEAVKLQDATGELIAYPHKSPTKFSNHFPYVTCFDEVGHRPHFSQDNWRYYRDQSWNKTVIIMAQFAQTGHKGSPQPEEMMDRYWLLHLENERRDGIKGLVREAVKEILVPPIYHPQPALGLTHKNR